MNTGRFVSRTRRYPLMGEINIIPLVDVVLVLLIIFMVTAPLLVRGIDMNLPKTQTNTIRPEKRWVLNILKEKIIYLDQEQIPFEKLHEKLLPLQGKPLYIRADQGVSYGEVMQVLDRVKQARIDQIGFLTELPKTVP